ncbi:PAS domain S-box protein [Pontibacillus marinus]|uniref:histidine kinase n=1 Tax=Pontibacillus marinus BH030004 = DSM 16465 TaxID=1385511 RepID=A0A0A5GJP7_9BACI|nr:PAS domain S-box protein [Pontibacillus marinus]KGX91433.1 diguanylate cyclase [Pontibacillus marinus BH030004 = DSM 16465]
MEVLLNTYSSVIMLIAVILTLMTSYTSLDLFSLLHTSDRHKRSLFLAGISSMGIGIWVMNFLTMLAEEPSNIASNQLSISLLSFILGVSFTGIAFYNVISKKKHYLFIGSLLLTLSVFSNHVMGMYASNVGVRYDIGIFILSTLLIYGSFLFVLWILTYYNFATNANNLWIKPLSSIIVTGAILEGYILLTQAAQTDIKDSILSDSSSAQDSFVLYLVLFISILIIAGLLWSSTLISNRLATSDSYINDIKFALDESSIVAITNAQGKITYVNDKLLDITGYEEYELIGQDHNMLNSGYHSKEFFKDLWKTIGSGEVWKGEIKNKKKDGSFYWVDTTIVPFLNKKGKPYQYIAIRTDITDRKEAEVQLKETVKEVQDIQFALDQSTIVAITDEKGIIQNVNDKFCEISKYSREELLGEDHRILNSGFHDKAFFKDLWRTIGSGEVWKGEIRNKAKDGSYYWVDTTIVPFMKQNGKPYQYLAIRNDITERKKTEEVLRRQDKLSAVGQLAAGVAHEIRNPLTSIRGYAEFLQLDEEEDERSELLAIITEEIERVNDIVEDFMMLAKPKEVQLGTKNIVPMIQHVMQLLDYTARKAKVQVKFDCSLDEVKVNCDEGRLKQVFLNFIKNAIEATPKGGEVNVKCQLEADQVHIFIQDTGVGISKEQLDKIGEPFYTTKESGNGLGLMVSFQIIQSHNGKVLVESEQHKGTTFQVTLPTLSNSA